MTDRPKGRSPRRRRSHGSQDDEPARGFQPQRMRRVWQDIDRARDDLGLGSGDEAAKAAPWNVASLFDRVTGLAGEVMSWLGDSAQTSHSDPRTRRDTDHGSTGGLAPCTLVALLRQVPVVGRLVDLVVGD